MSSLELGRRCSYRGARAPPGRRRRPTARRAHSARSCGLPGGAAPPPARWTPWWGSKSDRRCLLTLYSGPASSSSRCSCPARTADRRRAGSTLEKAVGKAAFSRMFGLVLTDNGAEFSDCAAIERSALPRAAKGKLRCTTGDARQSQQKGGCERNHVELRKILPKGRGISFDRLSGPDCAVLMSHLNSEPRPSGRDVRHRHAARRLRRDSRALLDALGIEKGPPTAG